MNFEINHVRLSTYHPIVNFVNRGGNFEIAVDEDRASRQLLRSEWHRVVDSSSPPRYRWVRVIEPRRGENRSVSANGLRRKTQLSRNQSLISHLVSVLRRGLLCEISPFIFFIRPSSLLRNTYIRSRNRERERERKGSIAPSKFPRIVPFVSPFLCCSSILH